MNIRLIYINGSGKQVEKEFSEPMEIIGYIYRCWNAARNAACARRIRERMEAESKGLLEESK